MESKRLDALHSDARRLIAAALTDVEQTLPNASVIYPFGLYFDRAGRLRPIAPPLGEDERPIRRLLRARVRELVQGRLEAGKAGMAAVVDAVLPGFGSVRNGIARVEVYSPERSPVVVHAALSVQHRPLLPDPVRVEVVSVSD